MAAKDIFAASFVAVMAAAAMFACILGGYEQGRRTATIELKASETARVEAQLFRGPGIGSGIGDARDAADRAAQIAADVQRIIALLQDGKMGLVITIGPITLGPFPKIGIPAFNIPAIPLHLRFEK